MHCPMGDMLKLIWWAVIGLFRSRASLEAEILTLRHQLNVLRRKSPKRLTFSNFDRLVFAILYRFAHGEPDGAGAFGGEMKAARRHHRQVRDFGDDCAKPPMPQPLLEAVPAHPVG